MKKRGNVVRGLANLLVIPAVYLLSFLPMMVVAERFGFLQQAIYVYHPILRSISGKFWAPALEAVGVSDIAVFFLLNMYH